MLGFAVPVGAREVGFVVGREPDNSFTALLASPEERGQFLVEIETFKGGDIRLGARSMIGDMPVGAAAVADLPYAGAGSGSLTTLLYSDDHWVGDPSDEDKPNIAYEGRVSVPIRVSRHMPISPEADRRVQRQFGELELQNGDGELDPIVQSYAVDGRRVCIKYGPHMSAYKNFAVVADLLGVSWQSANESTVRISLRDRTYALEQRLQSNLYAGTGGAEGTSELTGKPKPLMFGRVMNVTPLFLDTTNLIYQFHDGAAFAVDGVFDQGLGLTYDVAVGDVANYAALVAATVAAGKYATCLAEGLFKLGSSPKGLVTLDARGDASPDYADTLDVIAMRLIKTVAGIADTFVNPTGWAGAASLSGELGFYIGPNELPTTADVLNMLASATGAWWGTDRKGRITAGRLISPEAANPIYRFDEYDVISLNILAAPVPRYRQGVAYQRNWSVQRGEDLADAVTDARRQSLAEPYQVSTAADTQVRVRHNEAVSPPPILSLYHNEADAIRLRDEKLDLHKVDRQIFQMKAKRLGFQFDMGRVAQLTQPRFGLQSGKRFVIFGIEEDGRNEETILNLWG